MASPSVRLTRCAHMRLVPLQVPRPSLLDLWVRYRFQSHTLARMAEVPECVVLAIKDFSLWGV